MKLKFTLLVLFIGLITQAQVIAHQPDDLVLCDDDDFAVFDLTQTFDQIIDGQDPFDLLIYFYETQQDADSNTNAIANDIAYMNISNPQTIYVRVEHATTSKYDTTNFELIVAPKPVIGSGPYSIELCDDLINGSTSTDEVSTFDLTGLNDDITLGNSTYSVFYYETLADQNNNNPINPDTAYQNITTPQTLYVSVFNEFGCRSTTLLTLLVLNNPSPKPQDPFEVCDDDNDGYAEFMLTDLDVNIIGGEAGVTIGYYETEARAVIGDPLDQLLSPYANIIPFTQVIYARAEYDPSAGGTGCYTIIEVVLSVNDTPIIGVITDYVLPDIGNDGIEEFSLFSKVPEILNGQTDMSISFYETHADAEIGITNALPDLYVNITNPQTIYVRLESDLNSCYSIGSFNLVVDTTASINDATFSDLTISPNPALDIIQIQSDNFSAETNVEVYNIQGQVVFSEVKNSATGNFTINVSDFASGMYFVQIQSEGKTVAKKLIKQ